MSREVQAQQVTAQAQPASIGTQPGTERRMTRVEIRDLVDTLGGLLRVLRDADPGDKLEVYRQRGLRPIYYHDSHTVLAETRPPPSSMCAVFVSGAAHPYPRRTAWAVWVGGGTDSAVGGRDDCGCLEFRPPTPPVASCSDWPRAR